MERTARWITAALLAVGALGAAAFAGATLVVHSDRAMAARHIVTRAMWVLCERLPGPTFAALAVATVGGAALAIYALRGRRWALISATVVAVAGIALAWTMQHIVVGAEAPRYRHRSPYVHAATELALVLTIYFALIALAAAVTLIARRRATGQTG
jgi:hypothetical protein